MRFSDYVNEFIGGLTIFAAMSYIIVANPIILSGVGFDFGATLVSTCIIAAAGSILIGFLARAPSAMACGMGLNNFLVSFSLAFKIAVPVLLLTNLVAGAFAFIFSSLKSEDKTLEQPSSANKISERLIWIKSLRPSIHDAINASIAGLLLAVALDFLRTDQAKALGADSKAIDFSQYAELFTADGRMTPVAIAALGVLFILFVQTVTSIVLEGLEVRKQKTQRAAPFTVGSAYVVGLLRSATLLASAVLSMLLLSQLSLSHDLPQALMAGSLPQLLMPGQVFAEIQMMDGIAFILLFVYFLAILFMLLMDVSGTPWQMLPEGAPNKDARTDRGFQVDSFANVVAPVLSVSPVSCYLENKVGEHVGDGVKTGVPAVLVGLLFGVVAYSAAMHPDFIQKTFAQMPHSIISPMLIWVFASIVSGTLAEKRDKAKADDIPVWQSSVESRMATLVTVGMTPFYGLAFGLAVGIVLVYLFAVLVGLASSRARKVKTEEHVVGGLATAALIAQMATLAELSAAPLGG